MKSSRCGWLLNATIALGSWAWLLPEPGTAAHGTHYSDGTVWRTVVLELPDRRISADGVVHIELLRPLAWIQDTGATVRDRVFLELDEMNLSGLANVRAILDGPSATDQPGRLVTATFRSVSNDVYELAFSDSNAMVRCTGAHPLYSIDRDKWVRAEALHKHERLRTARRRGYDTLQSASQLSDLHTVYNFEVSQDHDYWITRHELLAHNSYAAARRIKNAVAKTLFPNRYHRRRLAWFKHELTRTRNIRADIAFGLPADNLLDAVHGSRLVVKDLPVVGRRTAGTVDVEFYVGFRSHGKAQSGQPFERDISINITSYKIHWPLERSIMDDEDIPQMLAEQLVAQLRHQIRARGIRKQLRYKRVDVFIPSSGPEYSRGVSSGWQNIIVELD